MKCCIASMAYLPFLGDHTNAIENLLASQVIANSVVRSLLESRELV
jgi:hypothetical protein